jgi:hypothetical protein
VKNDPVVIEPMPMKNIGDCGIVCLAMLLGRPYADVLKASPAKAQHVGLSTYQMRTVAKRLGVALAYTVNVDESAVGILDLDHEDGVGHYVLYAKDTIYNPAQNEWWTDVEAYLQRGCDGRPYVIAGLFART